MTVTVIDLGMGNIGSVANMFRKIGVQSELTSDRAVVARAGRIVLPGVGSFDVAMERLRARGLDTVLGETVLDGGVPILGICLGMQLLADGSEEGELPGLGWISGQVRRLPSESRVGAPVKVPHIGWSELQAAGVASTCFPDEVTHDERFYFVHSYAFHPSDSTTVLATADYGSGPFCAAVGRDRILGVQFHPEKSHRHGMAFLRRYLKSG